jgi:hypothetical protein
MEELGRARREGRKGEEWKGGGEVEESGTTELYKNSTLGRAREPLVVAAFCNSDLI